ncbi:MAG TPA: helix-turn-helix transcriptional regulator [Ktedonobacteraceae bacterium]
MQEDERRQALADFLRQRRKKLSPADVGLPPGMRRRTPGLRREEVAHLANMGTSWYVWLEQGRDVHPSAQILESIAQALQLTPNERRHLFLLAGQALPPHASSTDECISPAIQRMLDDLNPTPAYVMGRRLDYLAWSKAADAIFSLEQATSPYERNMVWRLFTNSRLREHLNWEMMVRSMLAEFRAANARYPGDRWFDELIEDLKHISPEFCRWWPHHDASSVLEGHKLNILHSRFPMILTSES